MFKNKAGQKVAVFAWDSTTGAPKTGDAANITAYVSKDGGSPAASNDVNPTELDATNAKGVYLFDPTQAESNADCIVWAPVSSTTGVHIEPVIIYTVPETPSVNVLTIESADATDTINTACSAALSSILSAAQSELASIPNPYTASPLDILRAAAIEMFGNIKFDRSTGKVTWLKSDGSTPLGQGDASDDGTTTTRGRIS